MAALIFLLFFSLSVLLNGLYPCYINRGFIELNVNRVQVYLNLPLEFLMIFFFFFVLNAAAWMRLLYLTFVYGDLYAAFIVILNLQ